MDPVLIEVPERIETERLILRCPRPGDGPTVNEAERETRAELKPWMPWAHVEKSLDDSEAYCRRMQARFLLREDLVMFIFERDVMGREGRFLGGTGLHRIDWTLRGFEIGYWRRTGCGAQGYVTEAVRALADLAFGTLGVVRLEAVIDEANAASRRVAERCGFALEGIHRHDRRAADGGLRNTCIYARLAAAAPP